MGPKWSVEGVLCYHLLFPSAPKRVTSSWYWPPRIARTWGRHRRASRCPPGVPLADDLENGQRLYAGHPRFLPSMCEKMRSIEDVHGNHSSSPQRLQRSQRPHWNPFRFHGQIAWEPHFSYPQPSIGWCQGLSSTVYGSWNVSKIRIKREDESMEHYGGRFRFFGEGFPIDPFWVHEKPQTGPTKASFCS